MSKNDPDLLSETAEIKFKHPFAVSTNTQRPVKSRFLLSIRTKNDFTDPRKLSSENTIDAILLRRKQQNPY